jgi:hypothetical protein
MLDENDAMDSLDSFGAELPRVRASPSLRAERVRLLAERSHRRGERGHAVTHVPPTGRLLWQASG